MAHTSSQAHDAAIVIREHLGQAFYEAKFRHSGRQVKRRIGRAWLERDNRTGAWRRRRGRVPADFYDLRRAHVAAAELVRRYVREAAQRERLERERRERGATFREVALGYLRWLAEVKRAKPSTLADYRYVLAEPGTPHKRGGRRTKGHIMACLGDLVAAEVSARDIERLLTRVSRTGVSPRAVNKYRAVVSSVYGYGVKDSSFALPANPAAGVDKRREEHPGALVYFRPEEIEALARTLAAGREHDALQRGAGGCEHAENGQDAEVIRVAAYAGLRLGELLALRWRDVDFVGHALTVNRALSLGIESSPKSGRVRRVPLPDQAAAALDRLSRRAHFTGVDELVFCNALGRPLDGSALRRRFKRARDAAGLRPLRFHDLRHTYGSLLAADGVDLVTIQAAMGHSALATTARYLHARPATDLAARFTQAFEGSLAAPRYRLSRGEAPRPDDRL